VDDLSSSNIQYKAKNKHFRDKGRRNLVPNIKEAKHTFRNSCPVLGLNMKIAPLIGLVVRFPSNVLWIVTRYTLVSSTNQII
jgi:hypothetical protein